MTFGDFRLTPEQKMDALAREIHKTHDLKVKEENERLAKEYGKLKQPWVFKAS